jgi:hypothetical protein
MTGLPQDNPQKSLRSMMQSCEMGADFFRIYPTLVLRDTPLAQLYAKGSYRPQELAQAVSLAADMLAIAMQHGIPVIRLGLNPSPSLEQALLAGPYHPAFGQLAHGALKLQQALALLGSVGEMAGEGADGEAGKRAGREAGERASGEAEERAGGEAGERTGREAEERAGGEAGERTGGEAEENVCRGAGEIPGGEAAVLAYPVNERPLLFGQKNEQWLKLQERYPNLTAQEAKDLPPGALQLQVSGGATTTLTQADFLKHYAELLLAQL